MCVWGEGMSFIVLTNGHSRFNFLCTIDWFSALSRGTIKWVTGATSTSRWVTGSWALPCTNWVGALFMSPPNESWVHIERSSLCLLWSLTLIGSVASPWYHWMNRVGTQRGLNTVQQVLQLPIDLMLSLVLTKWIGVSAVLLATCTPSTDSMVICAEHDLLCHHILDVQTSCPNIFGYISKLIGMSIIIWMASKISLESKTST